MADIADVTSGQSPPGSSYNQDGIGMEFHQGKKHFGDSSLNASGVWTTEVTRKALPGDIVMSVRAPVGPINYVDREVCIGRGLASIRPNEAIKRGFLEKFLATFLQLPISLSQFANEGFTMLTSVEQLLFGGQASLRLGAGRE